MIEEFIPAGYQNRVSRAYLHEVLHITDREIRSQIADAGERGVLIASYGGGYFRRESAADDPYIEAYIALERKRFTTQSRKLKLLRKAMKGTDEIPGQMSFKW